MGLTLIERYIFRKGILAVLIAAAGLIGVLWVVRAVQSVDVILNKGQGIATYLKMTTLGVPTLAAAIAPLALLIGLIRTINTLNDDSELVVIHASGASRVSLLKPFLAISFLVMVVVYVLHLWAGPTAMQTLRTYVTQVRADLVSVVVKEGAFQDVGTGLTFHVARRAPGGVLKGVMIVDGREDKETFTYLAQEGQIAKQGEEDFLILQNGQIQRFDNLAGNLSIIKFNSYAFNLSSFAGGNSSASRSQMEVSTPDLFNPDPDDILYLTAPGRFRAELHTRLTGGLYPLMVGLMVLAFMGNPNSHRQSQAIVVTSLCCWILLLRGITIVGEGALRTNAAAAFLVWGIPLLAIAVSAALLIADRSAFPPELLTRTENFLHNARKRLEPIISRLRGHRLPPAEGRHMPGGAA